MEGLHSLLLGKGLALEILHHEVVGGTGQSLVQSILIVVSSLLPVDLHGNAASLTAVVILEGLHVDQVDHGNVLTGLHGNEHRADGNAEGCVDLVEHAGELGLGIVAFIDKESLGNTGSTSVIPRKLGTNLNTGLTVYADDGGIGNTDSLLHFTGEIQEAGGVQHVDLGILPGQERGSSRKSKASCLLLCVVVADRVGAVNGAQTVGGACDEQHGFSQGGLTGSAVTEKRQITELLGVEVSHFDSPLSPYRTPSSPRDGDGHLSLLSV